MKKSFIIAVALILGVCVTTVSAVEVTRFGPKQYTRTTGKPNIEFRISNGTIYQAQGRSEAKMHDQRSLWDFRSFRAVFCSIALSSANPFGTLLERARSV